MWINGRDRRTGYAELRSEEDLGPTDYNNPSVYHEKITCEKITITCNGENLEQVESFRYLGAIVEENGDGGKEIRARLGMARTAMGSLTALWKDRTIGTGLKLRLMGSLVWPVALYGCETWTLRVEEKRKISTFEMTTYRRMRRVSWREFRTNESILEELMPERRLLEVVKRRKLSYFGHMIRADKLPAFIYARDMWTEKGHGEDREDDGWTTWKNGRG